MTQSIQIAIQQLTSTVSDANAKPLLRPVVEAELLKLGFPQKDVSEAVDEFFKVTLQ